MGAGCPASRWRVSALRGIAFALLACLAVISTTPLIMRKISAGTVYGGNGGFGESWVLDTPGFGIDGRQGEGVNHSEEASKSGKDPPDIKKRKYYLQLAQQIASTWDLTTPTAVALLELQFYKKNDYDPHGDFIHFHHLHKSGGTSLSGLMDRTLGLIPLGGKGNVDIQESANSKWNKFPGILPGSYRSGNFKNNEAKRAIETVGNTTDDLPYIASYAHTGLRPIHGPKQSKMAKLLLQHFPHKRLRAIAMLRDPTDFRASNHAMIMCGLNAKVQKWNKKRVQNGLKRVCNPKGGLNISSLVDESVKEMMDKCREGEELETKGEVSDLKDHHREACNKKRSGIDVQNHCRSAAHLLASENYNKSYRSMFTGLMGRFHRGQSFGGTAEGRLNYGFKRAEESEGFSVQAVEEYTLEDLGGLDRTSISGAGDGVGPAEPDFVWFGITERMAESICLFNYQFKTEPLKQEIKMRVQDCPPTSWWTEEDRESVKQKEPADYGIWRAANAIMDVRLIKMKDEIQARLDLGETAKSMPYVGLDCFNHFLDQGYGQ